MHADRRPPRASPPCRVPARAALQQRHPPPRPRRAALAAAAAAGSRRQAEQGDPPTSAPRAGAKHAVDRDAAHHTHRSSTAATHVRTDGGDGAAACVRWGVAAPSATMGRRGLCTRLLVGFLLVGCQRCLQGSRLLHHIIQLAVHRATCTPQNASISCRVERAPRGAGARRVTIKSCHAGYLGSPRGRRERHEEPTCT